MPANHLLAQLAGSTTPEWWGELESIPLALRQVLYDIDCPIEHVYFVEEGMVSIVSAEFGGAAVETGTVGHEGLVGLPVFLGSGSTSSQAFCQIAGRARRMTAGAFMAAVGSDARLRSVLGRYTQAFLTRSRVRPAIACTRLASVARAGSSRRTIASARTPFD